MMTKSKPSERRARVDPRGAVVTPVAKLDRDMKAKIGHHLRLMYGEVVNQGVPERFVEILRGLDAPEKANEQP